MLFGRSACSLRSKPATHFGIFAELARIARWNEDETSLNGFAGLLVVTLTALIRLGAADNAKTCCCDVWLLSLNARHRERQDHNKGRKTKRKRADLVTAIESFRVNHFLPRFYEPSRYNSNE